MDFNRYDPRQGSTPPMGPGSSPAAPGPWGTPSQGAYPQPGAQPLPGQAAPDAQFGTAANPQFGAPGAAEQPGSPQFSAAPAPFGADPVPQFGPAGAPGFATPVVPAAPSRPPLVKKLLSGVGSVLVVGIVLVLKFGGLGLFVARNAHGAAKLPNTVMGQAKAVDADSQRAADEIVADLKRANAGSSIKASAAYYGSTSSTVLVIVADAKLSDPTGWLVSDGVKADAIQTIGKDSCGTSAGGKMAACVRSTTGKSIYVIAENQDPSYAASALDEVWKNI